MKLQLDDGFGLVEVEIVGRDGTPGAAATLDLFSAYNTYAGLKAKADGDAVALGNAWVDYLAGQGLPGLSHGAGFKVFNHLVATFDELKKKDTPASSPSPASAASTGSPSGG